MLLMIAFVRAAAGLAGIAAVVAGVWLWAGLAAGLVAAGVAVYAVAEGWL